MSTPRPLSRHLARIARVVALAVGALAAAAVAVMAAAGTLPVGSGPDERGTARALRATGVLTITNSRDGAAVLTAAGMRTGSVETGDVTIANTGDLEADLSLAQGAPGDTPGPGGGELSSILQLRVTDQSSSAQVFDGTLDEFSGAVLPKLAAGAQRTYRFRVTFPDGGVAPPGGGDNVYRGSSVTVGYTWIATAEEPVDPGQTTPGGGDGGGGGVGTTTGGDGPPGGGTGTTTGSGNSGDGVPPPPQQRLFRIGRARLARGRVTLRLRCVLACRVTVGGTISVPGASKVYRLRAARTTIGAGATKTIRVKLSKSAAKAVQRALRRRKRVKVNMTARAVDSAGTEALRVAFAVRR